MAKKRAKEDFGGGVSAGLKGLGDIFWRASRVSFLFFLNFLNLRGRIYEVYDSAQ